MNQRILSFVQRILTRYEILVPVAFYILIMLPNLGFVGLYDGNYYQECIFEASKSLLRPERLFCYGHPSIVFFELYAIAMRMSNGSVIAFNIVTIFFGVLSVLAFASITQSLLPKESRVQRMLLTSLYVTHPLILATTLNVSADTGFMLFSVVFLACLFQRRYTLAAISGFFLVFSKEPGIVFLVVSSVLWIAIEAQRAGRKGIVETWRLLLPIIGFGFYIVTGAYAITYPPNTNLYFKMGGMMNTPMIQSFFSFNPADPRFHMFLGGVFVLNFAWIASFVIATAVCTFVFCFFTRPKRLQFRCKPEAVMIATLLIVFIYALTRVSPANNFRYLGPVFALFLLVFGTALSYVVHHTRLRIGILMVILVLQAASVYHTVDSLSKYLFGTFSFGGRKLLILDRATPPCCSYGIDEVLYNFEFMTRTRQLQRLAYTWIRPNSNTFFVHDTRLPEADRIDFLTSNVATIFGSSVLPQYIRTDDARLSLPMAPREVFFMHYPNNFGLYSSVPLFDHYVSVEQKVFEVDGYELAVSRFVRR